MARVRFFRGAGRARLGLAAASLLFASCATQTPPPGDLDVEREVSQFDARSLNDPGLQRYLQENLGRIPTTWDFEALCWVGFYYHPSLELARAQWVTAQAARQTAAARTNPSLTLTPGYDFTRQSGVSPWMPTIAADFLVSTAGKRALQVRQADAEVEASRLAILTAAWQMRSDLRKALLEANGAARRVEVVQRQSDAQQRLANLLEQRYEAGGVAAPEVSTARLALLRAQSAAADAALQLRTAQAHVATALGMPAHALEGLTLPAVPVPPALAPADFAVARRVALQARPDILAALAKYRSADAALGLELRRRMPDVHLGPSYQYDQGLNKWSLGLTFELPVFNHNEGPIAEAKSRRDEAAAQFMVVQNQIVGAIDSAIAAMHAAEAEASRVAALRREANQMAKQAEQRKTEGAADAVEVALADIDQAATESAALDAESALAAAAGQLEDALQIPFEHFDAVTHGTTSTPRDGRPKNSRPHS
jgi:cobalt-zinc-cadmium efflux system outer membrane protein